MLVLRKLVFSLVIGLFPQIAAADPLSFVCSFDRSVAANISREFGIQIDERAEKDFTIRFVSEVRAETAQMIGNNGAANVIPIWGDNRVTFVEITPNGTVQTTAVYGFRQGEKAAVHSRTTGGEGYELPSQYYGFCEVR
ncbi:hypothetical protein COL8621_00512 [Actibacterium lipolyticum]|uniref:Adhesin n=2 Tax=Actibacterium lipolyticum TaxID=1524263 RepID=A0A238JMB5_9RHOB|nr:hypothetical protein COL8621_00512 [Actibacterium lipolyticum]